MKHQEEILREWFLSLDRAARENLAEKITFESGPKGRWGSNLFGYLQGKNLQAEKTASAKALSQECSDVFEEQWGVQICRSRMIQDKSGGRWGRKGKKDVMDPVSMNNISFYSERNEKALGRGH